MSALTTTIMTLDWALLREQKEYCVNEAHNNPEVQEIYSGIVNLIDAIQDAALIDDVATEAEIFGEPS